ncbi:MAG: hypothetical protein K2L98_01605 [Bacilli bacterium]|nr:hypothetical protein [Bacilli bacterium]
MRKLVNNFNDTSVLVNANKCIKHQKRAKSVNPRRVALAITVFGIAALLSIFASPVYVFLNLASLFSILLSAHSLKNSAENAIKVFSSSIAWMANGYDGLQNTFIDNVEIEIVPKNMKIGEDLEAINIVPIFKDGHYVIIKSFDHPCFIRVYDDGKEEVAYVMESTSDDIETLEQDLPEYKEYIDVLRLQNTPTYLP